MLQDFSLGTIIYVLVSIIFGRDFSAYYYLLALVLAALPDIDFIPYIIFRKRLSLVTHRSVHYPLVFFGVSLIVFTRNPYLGILSLALFANHFVADSFSATEYPTGIRWFFPFSKKSWYILQGKIYKLTEAQQNEQLDKRKNFWNTKGEKRTALWEIMVRLGALTLNGVIFAGIAIASITFLLLRS